MLLFKINSVHRYSMPYRILYNFQEKNASGRMGTHLNGRWDNLLNLKIVEFVQKNAEKNDQDKIKPIYMLTNAGQCVSVKCKTVRSIYCEQFFRAILISWNVGIVFIYNFFLKYEWNTRFTQKIAYWTITTHMHSNSSDI